MPNYFIIQKDDYETFIFGIIPHLANIIKNIKNNKKDIIINIPIINLFVKLLKNLKTSYNFYKYHYFKTKIILFLLLLIDIVYFYTSCFILLYDNLFFET